MTMVMAALVLVGCFDHGSHNSPPSFSSQADKDFYEGLQLIQGQSVESFRSELTSSTSSYYGRNDATLYCDYEEGKQKMPRVLRNNKDLHEFMTNLTSNCLISEDNDSMVYIALAPEFSSNQIEIILESGDRIVYEENRFTHQAHIKIEADGHYSDSDYLVTL